MADKIATREAYGDALAEFGALNENIVDLPEKVIVNKDFNAMNMIK